MYNTYPENCVAVICPEEKLNNLNSLLLTNKMLINSKEKITQVYGRVIKISGASQKFKELLKYNGFELKNTVLEDYEWDNWNLRIV